MIKIGFNIIPLKSGHKFRGIGEYASNLLQFLKKSKDFELIEFENLNDLQKVDIIHYPFFDLFSNTLPFFKKFPTVVTILDVIPLVFPNHYPAGIKGSLNNLLQKISLKNTQAVITISENSKKDIKNFLKIAEEKIFVTYLAQSDDYKKIQDKYALDQVSNKFNLPKKFVFFGGNNNWNKNLLNSVEACLDVGVDIVLRGESFREVDIHDHPELKSYNEFLGKYSKHPKVHVLKYLSENESISLYNLAKLLLLPSFYEGFGLPILEAQACGIPVITSNTSSMPEVGQNSVVYVDPESIVDISNAIKKVFQDDSLRKNLIAKGFENIKRFSWDKTAAETINVYKKVLNV